MEELINKQYWTNADIMAYAGCGKTKASQIRREALVKHDGLIPLLPRKVKRDAVLKVLGGLKWVI